MSVRTIKHQMTTCGTTALRTKSSSLMLASSCRSVRENTLLSLLSPIFAMQSAVSAFDGTVDTLYRSSSTELHIYNRTFNRLLEMVQRTNSSMLSSLRQLTKLVLKLHLMYLMAEAMEEMADAVGWEIEIEIDVSPIQNISRAFSQYSRMMDYTNRACQIANRRLIVKPR